MSNRDSVKRMTNSGILTPGGAGGVTDEPLGYRTYLCGGESNIVSYTVGKLC